MRIKILMLGMDPSSLIADAQLLKERGFLVVTAENMQNIHELVDEVKSDVVFFDQHEPNVQIMDACNDFVNDAHYTNIPVVLTLSDDDEYLVTGERTNQKMKADNIIDAIKLALQPAAQAISRKISRKGRTSRIALSH